MSISAQSWASVPPAPALMETMASLPSSWPFSIRSREKRSIRACISATLTIDFGQGLLVAFFLAEFQQDLAFLEFFRQGGVALHQSGQLGPFLQDRLGLLRPVPEPLPCQHAFDFLKPFSFSGRSKILLEVMEFGLKLLEGLFDFGVHGVFPPVIYLFPRVWVWVLYGTLGPEPNNFTPWLCMDARCKSGLCSGGQKLSLPRGRYGQQGGCGTEPGKDVSPAGCRGSARSLPGHPGSKQRSPSVGSSP